MASNCASNTRPGIVFSAWQRRSSVKAYSCENGSCKCLSCSSASGSLPGTWAYNRSVPPHGTYILTLHVFALLCMHLVIHEYIYRKRRICMAGAHFRSSQWNVYICNILIRMVHMFGFPHTSKTLCLLGHAKHGRMQYRMCMPLYIGLNKI